VFIQDCLHITKANEFEEGPSRGEIKK